MRWVRPAPAPFLSLRVRAHRTRPRSQIDDLEAPYTAYSTKYMCGFDTWPPVASNPRLLTTLALFSASSPPPLPPHSAPHPPSPPIWTLDALFLLPKARLGYYRRLYGGLMRGTERGRSDWRLLSAAMGRLERILGGVEGRVEVVVEVNEEGRVDVSATDLET